MYRIYLKKAEGNQISIIKNTGKILEVEQLDYVAGCLHSGSYYLPLDNILFIEEV